MKFGAFVLSAYLASASATLNQLERQLVKDGSGSCKTIDLDFNSDFFTEIDYVDHELIWEELGIRVTVGNTGRTCKKTTQPRIFDASNPTCGDDDLLAPDIGKAIIIQENKEKCSEPNDCRTGGTFRFEFKQRVELLDVNILDVDEEVTVTGTHLQGGTFDLGSVPIQGDGKHYNFPLNKKNVVELQVQTGGSIAINNLRYIKCDGGGNGDPHFQTWTGYKFDYHGQCDLALVNAPNHNGEGMDIQVRTTQRDFYSYISAVAMKLGSSIMEVTYDGILIDGQLIQLEGSTEFDFHGYKTTFDDSPSETGRKQSVIEVHTGGNEHVTIKIFDKYMAVRVWNPDYKNFLGATGLMGDFNTSKLLGRDGVTEFEDANLFGEHWQVNDSDPKLFSSVQEPQFPAMCVPAPDTNSGRKLRHGISEAQAQQACASADDVEDCVFDVMATGDVHIVGAHQW